jgi:hypothetical protein
MSFCSGTAPIWQFLGNVLTIVKIVIPILILFFGVLDFGKAVVASKDDEIKKSLKSLLFRILSGTVIFFIPVLIEFAFGLVGSFGDIKSDYEVCVNCLTSPKNCKTS